MQALSYPYTHTYVHIHIYRFPKVGLLGKEEGRKKRMRRNNTEIHHI
jgi:hypothetical protein